MTPVNRTMNEPITLAGVDFRLLFGILIGSVVIGLLLSKLGGALLLFSAPPAASWFTRRDPRMFELWSLAFQQRSYYDSGKRR